MAPAELEALGPFPYGREKVLAGACPECSGHLSLVPAGEGGRPPYWRCQQGHAFRLGFGER